MIGSIISFIGDFAKTCNVGGGDVYFECDSADLIAVKIDTVPRTNDDGHANFGNAVVQGDRSDFNHSLISS